MNEFNDVARKRIEHLTKTLSEYRKFIIAPTVLCTVLALGYAIMKSNTWTARQSLVIRDDLIGSSFKPGRFDSLDSLKSAQETVLEIARKPDVIQRALEKLGPPPSMITGRRSWPNEKVIESTQGRVSFSAPNGAEFGKTEVILLNVQESTRERTREFIGLMLDEIDAKMREVRQLKVGSMVSELDHAVDTAQSSFDAAARKLQEMETQFGADLSTLRALNLQQSGDGSLQATIVQIRSEQRVAQNKVDLAIKQRELLGRALRDPQQYLVTSSELLQLQPRLAELVSGLSKAELELSAKRGKFTEKHTEVISAKSAIRDIKVQILKEIQASIHGLGTTIETNEERVAKLKFHEKELEQRLSGLSGARVAYEKLENEVSKKGDILNQAREDLAKIKALGDSTVNLLTRVGDPQVATRPDGPGNRAIVGAGVLGGLLIGLGLVMFLAPPFESDDGGDFARQMPTPDGFLPQDPQSPQGLPDHTPAATTPDQPVIPNVGVPGIGHTPQTPTAQADATFEAYSEGSEGAKEIDELLSEESPKASFLESEQVASFMENVKKFINDPSTSLDASSKRSAENASEEEPETAVEEETVVPRKREETSSFISLANRISASTDEAEAPLETEAEDSAPVQDTPDSLKNVPEPVATQGESESLTESSESLSESKIHAPIKAAPKLEIIEENVDERLQELLKEIRDVHEAVDHVPEEENTAHPQAVVNSETKAEQSPSTTTQAPQINLKASQGQPEIVINQAARQSQPEKGVRPLDLTRNLPSTPPADEREDVVDEIREQQIRSARESNQGVSEALDNQVLPEPRLVDQAAKYQQKEAKRTRAAKDLMSLIDNAEQSFESESVGSSDTIPLEEQIDELSDSIENFSMPGNDEPKS